VESQNPLLALIPLFPFIGFVINATLGRKLPKTLSGGLASLAMFASFVLSATLVWQLASLDPAERVFEQIVYTWISSGPFVIDLKLRVDALSAVMILVVTGIGFLIHVYSTAYMHEEVDGEYARYFSYLNLFASFMLILVLGANFPVMFVGWEGVGLCSYLLIGFWFTKRSAADAGKKAFIVNRIGDYAFILGMLAIYTRFGSLDFQQVAMATAALEPETSFGILSIATLLLFIGATGKSAQIPLYVWLPDAMEGPTPVSALIHAATMVTAGVYMIGRNAELFSHAPETLMIVAVVGAVTALMAGTIGLVQNDIKRVLAYSTVSQLGLMFLAMGVGAFGAGIFHLYTHAFFKALLFLGSGAVIHALHGEQDIRNMGGLKKYLPITFWTFFIGSLAIAGVPGLAGFFSKDEILYETFKHGHQFLWVIGAVTSLLTATYMFRLVFLTFFGERRRAAAHSEHPEEEEHGAHHGHLHDAPPAMAFVLIVLALGSVLAGYVGVPHALGGHNALGAWLAPAMRFGHVAEVAESATVGEEGSLELILMFVSSLIAVIGILAAYVLWMRRRELVDRLAVQFAPLYKLLLNKYYVDEIYDATIVQPVKTISQEGLWRGFDVKVVDATVNATGGLVSGLAWVLRRVQNGSVRAYAGSVFVGVVLILSYYLSRYWR
jgi:NADH-quinone oxidoreductase subunit L